MSSEIAPEDATWLRVKYRTEYEFCKEVNAITDDGPTSRQDVREAILVMAAYERRALQSRLRKRRERFEELTDGERKTFDEPHIEHSDLVSGVRIPNFDD